MDPILASTLLSIVRIVAMVSIIGIFAWFLVRLAND